MSVGRFPQPKNVRHVKLCVSNLRLDAARGVLTPFDLLQKWEGQVLFPPLFGSAHSVSFRSWIPYGLVSCMVSGFCIFKKSVIDNLIVFQWFLHVPGFYGSPKIPNMHDFTVFKLARFLSVLCILSLRLLALQFWFPWFLRFLCFSGFIFNFQGFPDFYDFHGFYFPGFCWAASSVWNRIISSVPNRAGSLVSHWVVSSVPNRVVCLIRGNNQCRSDVIWSLFCM
jgi:hypothetical protein